MRSSTCYFVNPTDLAPQLNQHENSFCLLRRMSNNIMRSLRLTALAAAILMVSHTTAGAVGPCYCYEEFHQHNGAASASVSLSDDAIEYASSDNLVDYTTSSVGEDYAGSNEETDDASTNDETMDCSAVAELAGSGVPSNAPPDVWMNRDHTIERRFPRGHHNEFMFCHRKFNKDRNQCSGTCNYVAGKIENEQITLFAPNTRCVVVPYDLSIRSA